MRTDLEWLLISDFSVSAVVRYYIVNVTSKSTDKTHHPEQARMPGPPGAGVAPVPAGTAAPSAQQGQAPP